MENIEYTKIDDSTIGMVNTVPISIADLLAQKKNGQDMIDQGQTMLGDANRKIEQAITLGIIIPNN